MKFDPSLVYEDLDRNFKPTGLQSVRVTENAVFFQKPGNKKLSRTTNHRRVRVIPSPEPPTPIYAGEGNIEWVDAKSTISFQYHVVLSETMKFEEIYPHTLRLSLSEKTELKSPTGIWVWMFLGDNLIGEAYGVPLDEISDETTAGLNLLFSQKEILYCCSNTILPQYQGRGFGKILKSHFLGIAQGRGFKAVVGHARVGGSEKLNAFFGVQFLQDFPDWFFTGETYRLYQKIL